MLALSFARAQKGYFLVSIFIGFAFVSDQGEQTIALTCYNIILKCATHAMSVHVVCYSTALAIPCQVYPSEYAYHDDSVNRAERSSANCRRYPPGSLQGLQTEEYVHCDGTQLKLADSDVGLEQYSSSDYYVWSAGRDGQLLFIFPTRVSLTTITLHYYSDSDRGLSRLRFYAVPDDFDVWDALTTGTPNVDVAAVLSGGEPTGHRNVSINVNFNAKKVLMYKYSSSLLFAVSEMEFFTSKGTSLLESISLVYSGYNSYDTYR